MSLEYVQQRSEAPAIVVAARRLVPWRVMQWLGRHWRAGFQLLRFGTTNVNTAEHWDDAWSRHGHDGFRATGELPVVRERIVEYVKAGSAVLDVGCGVGELLSTLQRAKQCRCHGMDISPVAVEGARARGFEARVSALPQIPFADAMFDAVVTTETLEHVSNVKTSLAEMDRVLKPGGLVAVSVPDGDVDNEDVHIHRFNRERLTTMMERHFTVTRVDRVLCGGEATLIAFAKKAHQA